MSLRTERVRELLIHQAAEFLERESDRSTMITVTDARISNNLNRATIFFTVYPEEKEDAALAFAKRQSSEFRSFIKKKLNMKRIPMFEFAIDEGEKNRQNIDRLSNEN
ncbi:ribosome-binding factor A [Patescibacteria group bacterium]|nr:ribosome-binding factor A [Patescibacteria group bacterium]